MTRDELPVFLHGALCGRPYAGFIQNDFEVGERRPGTAICAKCGAAISTDAVYCSSCGAPVSAAAGASVGTGAGTGTSQHGAPTGLELPGIAFNVAGLLCYILWPVAPVFFLLVGPYNRNRFVRFHAFQAVFLWLGGMIMAIALQIVTSILGLIPVLGWIASALIWIVFTITFFVLVIVMMYNAYNGQWYSVPVIGNLARQQAERLK